MVMKFDVLPKGSMSLSLYVNCSCMGCRYDQQTFDCVDNEQRTRMSVGHLLVAGVIIVRIVFGGVWVSK